MPETKNSSHRVKHPTGSPMGGDRQVVRKSTPAQRRTDRILPPDVPFESEDFQSPARDRLREERRRLIEEIQHQEIPIPDHPTSGTHMADEASSVADQITALALRRHFDELLKQVDRAIARAEQGAYGICTRCGNSIAPDRLQALPYTELCITCARARSRSSKTAAQVP
jgi:RNA polymerase-binding protein DksA